MPSLTLSDLTAAVQKGAALRLRRRLQPAGGPGDKVFPPTYEGGEYAKETRIIDGQSVPCVLLDSVQSQANRMELALLAMHRAGQAKIPVVTVDFAKTETPEFGQISSLEAPHRIADAILRDSMLDGVRFRAKAPTPSSTQGKVLDTVSTTNATGLFDLCPTALVFGLWDSTGPRGGMGVKFQRALVGEVVGVGIETGVKPASRVDPLGIQLNAGPLYLAKDGGWTLDEAAAVQEKGGKAVKLGRDGKGKPSEANHGNVTPAIEKDEKGVPFRGGATMAYALQTVVLSLPALRRLRFPVPSKPGTDLPAQTVLAAIGLAGATLAIEQGCDLRSRCLLVPEGPATWELVAGDGTTTAFSLSGDEAVALLSQAIATATAAGLPWRTEDLALTPSAGLAALVKKSRELATQVGEE
jgi:CRISPR-associated protein Csb1